MKETASDSRRRSALSTRHSALAFVALSSSPWCRRRPQPPRPLISGSTPGMRQASTARHFFPESIAATPAGTLFEGSVVTGEICGLGPARRTPRRLYRPASHRDRGAG